MIFKSDIMKVKTTKEIGCVICQNPNLSEVINNHLVNASMDSKMLKEHLEDINGIYLTVKQIDEHRKHLFTVLKDGVDRKKTINETYENVSELKNIEIINWEIAELDFIIKEMIDRKQEDSVSFNNTIKIKQRYIEMKTRIEGEDTVVIEHKIPEWIKMRED